MMTLAQRVKDQRYAKGWGPDELASRASISRTALYQIESGRTELPRAGTLRRIAEALEIPTDALLAPDAVVVGTALTAPWVAKPVVAPSPAVLPPPTNPLADSSLFRVEAPISSDQDLIRKFYELLASPLGEGVARIVEESHRILPRMMRSSW